MYLCQFGQIQKMQTFGFFIELYDPCDLENEVNVMKIYLTDENYPHTLKPLFQKQSFRNSTEMSIR